MDDHPRRGYKENNSERKTLLDTKKNEKWKRTFENIKQNINERTVEKRIHPTLQYGDYEDQSE